MTYLDTLTENSFEPAAAGCDDEGVDVEAEVDIGGVDTVAKVGLNGCDVTIDIRGADKGVISRGDIFVFAANNVCGDVAKR